jgi:hypothetical protein
MYIALHPIFKGLGRVAGLFDYFLRPIAAQWVEFALAQRTTGLDQLNLQKL